MEARGDMSDGVEVILASSWARCGGWINYNWLLIECLL